MANSFDVQSVLNKALTSVGVEWYIKGILDSRKRIYKGTKITHWRQESEVETRK